MSDTKLDSLCYEVEINGEWRTVTYFVSEDLLRTTDNILPKYMFDDDTTKWIEIEESHFQFQMDE